MVLNGPMNLSKSVNLLCDPLINSICFDLLLESMISNKKSKARGLFTYFYVVLQITAGAAANVFGGKNVNPHHSHFCLSSSQSYLCVLSFHISLALSLSQKYRQITSRMNCIRSQPNGALSKGIFKILQYGIVGKKLFCHFY